MNENNIIELFNEQINQLIDDLSDTEQIFAYQKIVGWNQYNYIENLMLNKEIKEHFVKFYLDEYQISVNFPLHIQYELFCKNVLDLLNSISSLKLQMNNISAQNLFFSKIDSFSIMTSQNVLLFSLNNQLCNLKQKLIEYVKIVLLK